MIKTYFSQKLLLFLWLVVLGLTPFLIPLIWKHPFLFLLPVFLTPFYEWMAHKYILHKKEEKSSSSFQFHDDLHYAHHRFPSNVKHFFAPKKAVGFLFLKVSVIFGLVSWSWTGTLVATYASLIIFLIYEWFHLAHHVATYIPKTTWGKRLKKAHQHHHFYNDNYWWGVTSLVADNLLNTNPDPKAVGRSLKLSKF